MNRVDAKRIIAGTLALSCALGGLYIGSARTARAMSAALQAGDQQSGTAAAVAPRKERSEQADPAREAETPPIVGEAASMLGMNAAELRDQLKTGKSLAEVAQTRGMSEADLTAKLLQLRIVRIDAAVKSGKLDAAQAEQMKRRMAEHLSFMVREKRLLEKQAEHRGQGWKPDHEHLAAVLGISKDELRRQLNAGKSLADIAAGKGMSREQLIAKLKEQLTPQLERWVDRKHAAPAEK